MKNTLIGTVAGLVLGFLGGWYPEYGKRTAAEEQAASAQRMYEQTEHARRLSVFANRAAQLNDELSRNNFATATEQASQLFTDLRTFAGTEQAEPVRKAIEDALAPRDAIIAGLATMDPAAVAGVHELFLKLQELAQQH